MNTENIIKQVKRWAESMIVGLNFCPFAKRELVNDRVRFKVTPADNEESLLLALQVEFLWLNQHPETETTLLIHPHVLRNFDEYNQFLDYADNLLAHMGLEGVYQVASFHPDYQYHGTKPEDAENYINRSPYPLLHILRESSVAQAVASYPDIEQIPVRNIELANELGSETLEVMRRSCLK